jgi:uncharacterized protein (TIGR02271 family)
MAEIEIHRNDRVLTADGMEIGNVKHVIVDGPTRQVTDIVVARDGEEWLVPMSGIMRSGSGQLTLQASQADFASTAMFDRHQYHAVDESELDAESAGRATPGAATLERAEGDRAVIGDARGMETAPKAGTGRAYNDERLARRETGRAYRRDDEHITVPVVEERLKAGVRETEAGRARIVKDVREERQTIDVPVEREEVYVTERAVNRPATEADLSMREREIDIPLREQEVVTQKEAVVTGEVEVRKEVRRDTERVSDTVRREEVHVEGGESDRVHVEGLTEAQRRRFDTMGWDEQRRYAGMSAAEREAFDRDYDTRYTVSGQPTDTAYDRTGMAGDRYDTAKGEGILDRAKDKLRDASDDLRNR